MIAQLELGRTTPRREQLARMASCAGIDLAGAEEVLTHFETLRRDRLRQGAGVDDLLGGLAPRFQAATQSSYQRLLRLPLPGRPPQAEDRRRAEEQWAHLQDLPAATILAVMWASAELHTWALCEKICHESERRASGNVEEAAALAHLAEEIAARVRGSEGWRSRLQGYAAAHGVNALRVAGELKAAETYVAGAKRLWHAGSDPEGLLDPGRLLDLEASLRSAQRRCAEALVLLDQAAVVGRRPERVLIQKGVTLEKMGEYERAVEAFLQALPQVEQKGDRRLRNILDFNLAVSLCHLGRHGEAAELVPRVREIAGEDGDELALVRLTWLEGRIAAGLGRPHEALRLLAAARQSFAAETMTYDVALALLEEAALLLDLGRAAEVKELAGELSRVFAAKGVHREALGALRLFHQAAEREKATADLARRVLRFLFRARHDPELRFAG